jgi:TRAP-type C4-dicarboxylate transport system substrate-binding protein
MMKRITVLFAGLVAMLALVVTPVLAADINLRLGHPAPVTSADHATAEKFAKNLEELSGGSIHTEVIGGGVLGDPKQQLAQLQAGKLDFWFMDINALFFSKDARQFSVLFAPFLFRDQGHYRRFLHSDVFKEMMTDAEQKLGVNYLGIIGDRSPRALSTVKRGIASPDEMKGLKMRVPGLPFVSEIWKAWGASPTPIRGADIFQALQSGMVDGDDNGITTLFERGLMEVLKYHTPINYVHSGFGIYMSGHTWASLNDQQRACAKRAVAMVDKAQQPYDEMMKQYFDKARTQGIVIIEPDMPKFLAPTKEVLGKYDGEFWPAGLYQKIQNIP